jgi:protein-S-isoprenylcysteine O-methyltransferase Ste14
MVEWLILVCTGICGLVFTWIKFSIFPVSNIFGGLLILSAFVFHSWTEKEHRQAHRRSEDIDMLVTSGAYAKIRHPLYLSIIILNIGIGLSFGILLTFIMALLTIIHWIATSLKEEESLLRKFPDAYGQYKITVRWRMIPGIF